MKLFKWTIRAIDTNGITHTMCVCAGTREQAVKSAMFRTSRKGISLEWISYCGRA